ncbi:AAA domain-containing protein [Ekhidna sp.]|uniref:AAA domain-containing protein n=1 Tax=Ekhidna sp. TaxID=2608089 RepID=UPI0035174513
MAEYRLSQVARKLNVGKNAIIDFLRAEGFEIDANPNSKIPQEQYDLLAASFGSEVVPKDPLANFKKNYEPGTIVESTITKVIPPSQIVTQFSDGFYGRLSALDISHCIPESENQFSKLKEGQRIKAVVLDLDLKNRQIRLSQKHLPEVKPLKDSIIWARLNRGDELFGKVIEEYYDHRLLKLENGLYGVLHKSHSIDGGDEIKIKVNSKLSVSDLISLVPSGFDLGKSGKTSDRGREEFSFIEEDLRSYSRFKKSLLGTNASNDDHTLIKKGFEKDSMIFSQTLRTEFELYIQFELNSSAYEQMFKANAIPYFFNEGYTNENELRLLSELSDQKYWFRLSKSRDDIPRFTLYNNDINIYGQISNSDDPAECKFIIEKFSFGNDDIHQNKKKNLRYGSFLLANKLSIVNPFNSIPLDSSQFEFFRLADLKTKCFQTIYSLKRDAGEILRQEGKTLSINDKFLEYQINLINNDQKSSSKLITEFKQVEGSGANVAIAISSSEGDQLELDEDSVVNIRLNADSSKNTDEIKLMMLTRGKIKELNGSYIINFNKAIDIDLLKDGFYLDKKIPKNQFEIQRQIIQDFIEKKIDIDHIEKLLVSPEKIKNPEIKNFDFQNPIFQKSNESNNQLTAIRKAVGNQNIFLIQGPPGTGKTTVIAEIIYQLTKNGERVLVSGQNHVAVDNVLKKISEFSHLNLLRVGSEDRIDEELVQYNIDHLVDALESDFNTFLRNHIGLGKAYLDFRELELSRSEIKERFAQKVQKYVSEYGRLGELFKQRHFQLLNGIRRMESKEIIDLLDALEEWIDKESNDFQVLLKPFIYNSLDVVFATCIGIRTDRVFRESGYKFDTVIIDEAGKANIAETLVAIEQGKKVILVGDQKQLPPYINNEYLDERIPGSFPKSQYGSDFSKDEINHALKTSFFEFITDRISNEEFPEENSILLNYQHRMHPNIGEFVSGSFYNNMVKMGSDTEKNVLNLPAPLAHQVIFFDTSNCKNPYEQHDGYSAKNDTEAMFIAEQVLPKLADGGVESDQVAIIAPYKSQVTNIRNHIGQLKELNFRSVNVSTLDSFQGREYDVIIFSFTRSSDFSKNNNSKVGFLDDARRLNVAFSRAKKKLILIGNEKTLTDKRSHFDRLFNYTGLFKKLVSLSKKSGKGSFINVSDYYDVESPFERIKKKYSTGSVVLGAYKTSYKESGKTLGHFITIEGFDCFMPESFIPRSYKEQFKLLSSGNRIEVEIHHIDLGKKRVTVKPETWFSNILTLKGKNRTKGYVLRKIHSGFLIELDCGITALLPQNKIGNRHDLKLASIHDFKILKIDNNNKRILLSMS